MQGGARFLALSFLQVSEVYSLHRQTTYLAQDFFDRYMLTQEDVRKESLQLLGITALFIASKMEVSLGRDKKSPFNFDLSLLTHYFVFLKRKKIYTHIHIIYMCILRLFYALLAFKTG